MAKPIILSFSDLVAADMDNKTVLGKVSGFACEGGVTAVLGASGSGKTVLLSALAGRMNELPKIKLQDGAKINANGQALDGYTWSEQVRYSPSTNDHLIGVLSVKEHIELSSRLAHGSDPNWNHEAEVEKIINKLGLDSCEDTRIGTIYKRGISGGQQRRTCMAIELIAGANITIMDEPTSGLDTTTAIKCLDYLQTIVQGSKKGAIVSIHQPNNDMLAYFDNVLLLVDGETMFFGPVSQMTSHFNSIGCIAPESTDTPVTEHYLLQSDNIFGRPTLDMIDGYAGSQVDNANKALIQTHQAQAQPGDSGAGDKAGFFAQVAMLFQRIFRISYRDLTIYYLQFGIQWVYGFLVGALFWDAKENLDDTIETGFNTVTWITALMIYIFVFKVMFFNDMWKVQRHERGNTMYNVFTLWLADLLLNLLMFPGYLIGGTIAYYMIGFQHESFAYTLLNYYVGIFAAEQIPNLIVQFTAPNLGAGFIITQGVLLILFMFSGGTFIRDSKVDGTFWVWLKSISPFEHAGDSFMSAVWEYLPYSCTDPFISGDGQGNNLTFGVQWCNTTNIGNHNLTYTSDYCCVALTKGRQVFPCDYIDTLDGCRSEGLTVMDIFKGNVPDKWNSLAYLAIVGVGYRFFVLLFQVYPTAALFQSVRRLFKANNPAPNPVDHKVVAQSTAGTVRKYTEARDTSALRIAGADLTMINITVTLRKMIPCTGMGRDLIKNLSSVAKHGQITALMGPSGAGKTTLLNALSGMAYYAKVTGTAKLGNQPLSKDLLGYVPQFDLLIDAFTVRETLAYSFTLKCKSTENVDSVVVEVSKVVGLVLLLDVRISALTSGQRKLVSIADGLISKPSVLFLDEPTTGLDSTAAHEVVTHIASVAKIGVTVIMTIHQPSAQVFGMLDSMLLLDNTGNVAFDGPSKLAVDHFADQGFPTGAQDNPADVFLSAMDGKPENATSWAEAFKASTTAASCARRSASTIGKISPMYEQPAEFTRLTILIHRFTLMYWRIPDFYIYRFIVITVFGVLAGTLYANTEAKLENLTEIAGSIFFSVWCSLYLALGNIPVCFHTRKDGQNGYATGRHAIWTWCLAQFLASFVYVLACATIFVILVHFIPAINDSAESFFYVLLMSWLMQLIMEAVDWNLIEATKNELLSVASGMVVIGSFFIFAGFFIPVEEMVRPIFWMAYTMPTYYIFSGTLYVYLHGVDYDAGDGQTVSGDTVLNTYFNVDYSDQGDWRHWMDLLIAVAFLLVFRFQHYQFMVLNTKMLGASLPAGDDNADSDGNAASDDNADSDDNTIVAYERPEPQQQPKPTNYLNVKANKTMPTNTKPLTRFNSSKSFISAI